MPVLAIQPRPDALEIGFSVSLMLSQGFSRFKPSAVAVLVDLLSIWLMSLTLSVLPIGTAYAVWAGIGAAGIVALQLQTKA